MSQVSGLQDEINNDLQGVKKQLISSLNQKADTQVLDRLSEQVSRKADNKTIRQQLSDLKQEVSQSLSSLRSDMNVDRETREQKLGDRLCKSEMNYDSAMQDVIGLKEVLRQMQNDRRQDIEESRQLIEQQVEHLGQTSSRNQQRI